MEIEFIRPGILQFRDFLNHNECAHLIEITEHRGNWINAPIGRYQNNILIESKIDLQLRDVEVCDLEELGFYVQDFKNASLLNEALTVNFDLPNYKMSRAMISKYTPGSHIRPHRDTGIYTTNRLITCVAYLNEGYVGGSITFPDFHLVHAPISGECLCFYSEYLHGVDEIISGERYCVVWFAESDLVQAQYFSS